MGNEMNFINDVWKIEAEILSVIDKVCKDNKLRYSLAYGTLIGAVRHKGFIPWDDDIDIVMPREDYDKLIEIWDKKAPKGFILQNKHVSPDFTQNFTKIRKDHTTFLQDEEEAHKKYHKGIFVDIFPGDRVASGKVTRILQYFACAVNLLYSRGFTSGSNGLIGVIENILIKFPKSIQKVLLVSSEKFIKRWRKNKNLQFFFPNTIGCTKTYYPSNLFDEMTELYFYDKNYSCVKDYDGFLRGDYGDYMQLPPEEERKWTHHPIIVDFEKNYEEM